MHRTSYGKSILFCGVIAVASSIHAQSFTVEQALSAPFMSELVSAPHGSSVAWVEDREGSRNVWVADAPAYQPRQVTHYTGDNGQPIASLRLTPDGKTAIFARGSELNGDGRSANPTSAPHQPMQQVWAANIATGALRLLGDMGCRAEGCEDIQVSPDGQYAAWAAKQQIWVASITGGKGEPLTDLRGTATSPRWSPDGKRLAFALDRGDHSFLVVARLHDGQLDSIDYVAPSVDHDQFPRWSPDGAHLAFIRTRGRGTARKSWVLWVADTSDLKAAPVLESGTSSRDSLPPMAKISFYFAAGNHIIFDSEKDGWNHLYSIQYGSNAAPVLLTPGNFDVEDVTLSADAQSVVFSSNQEDIDRRHIWRVAVAGGHGAEAVSSGESMEWTPVATGDGKDVFCIGSTATTPSLIYRLSNGFRELITRNALPADFPSASFVAPKQVTFKSTDGYTIHGQLFLPKSQVKAGPALIFVHGGPKRQMMLGFHYMPYYANAYAENQYLASLGFTVLSVNYRLGIMYGREFREASHAGKRGASEYNDVLAGADYLRSLPNVDPARIGIWGGSYGGYLTALALGRNSNIFAAGVDFEGVHDWSTKNNDELSTEENAPDDDARQLARDSSPSSAVKTWRSPVLLIQGDDDRNVPFSQMIYLVRLLREKKVPFEQIVYPDEIHEFLLHRHWVDSYKATAQFLQKNLQGTHP